MKNDTMRELVTRLVAAEQKIGAAAQKVGARWGWEPWSRPSTGGPYMWNDIHVVYPDGTGESIQAQAFVDRVNGEK